MRTLILISLAAHLTLPENPEPSGINQLDQCIQKRFLDRTAFGMSRIATLDYHGARKFRAENAAEQAVVNQLEQKGYQVALYLAGRNVIAIAPPDSVLAPYRYGIQGPAYITHLENPKELPLPNTLLGESRTALAAFQTAERYDLQNGDWNVALRPLRAANEACVQCHIASGAKVKIGDPLGVVMYVYKR